MDEEKWLALQGKYGLNFRFLLVVDYSNIMSVKPKYSAVPL